MDNSIIANILEIDKNAKDRLAEAENKRNVILAEAKAEEERIIGDKVKAADEKLRQLDEDERRRAEAKIESIKKSGEEEIARLDKVFGERHTMWEDKIFSAVIS